LVIVLTESNHKLCVAGAAVRRQNKEIGQVVSPANSLQQNTATNATNMIWYDARFAL